MEEDFDLIIDGPIPDVSSLPGDVLNHLLGLGLSHRLSWTAWVDPLLPTMTTMMRSSSASWVVVLVECETPYFSWSLRSTYTPTPCSFFCLCRWPPNRTGGTDIAIFCPRTVVFNIIILGVVMFLTIQRLHTVLRPPPTTASAASLSFKTFTNTVTEIRLLNPVMFQHISSMYHTVQILCDLLPLTLTWYWT